LTRVAMLSGGKDSLYAASKLWPPDFGLVLVYDFPVPSPHLINLGKSVETLLLTGVSVVVVRLDRGKEREETVEVLRRLGASEIVAGDVYIEDHLKYMEGIAEDVGATLREPLWGRDPEELLWEILSWGATSLITGIKGCMRGWLGRILSRESAEEFVADARRCGYDPLGEKGEYHTLVLDSPLHRAKLRYSVAESIETKDFDNKDYYLIKVC